MTEFIHNPTAMQQPPYRIEEETHHVRSERIKRGMARKAAEGYHLHRVPVGYRRVLRDNRFVIEPDPFQAPLVYQAFVLAATGKWSLRKLLEIMTERGLRTTSGKKMSISSFHVMLGNPFYLGVIKSSDCVFLGKHQAILGRKYMKFGFSNKK